MSSLPEPRLADLVTALRVELREAADRAAADNDPWFRYDEVVCKAEVMLSTDDTGKVTLGLLGVGGAGETSMGTRLTQSVEIRLKLLSGTERRDAVSALQSGADRGIGSRDRSGPHQVVPDDDGEE